MERTPDGKISLSMRGLWVANAHDGNIVIRPPLLSLIMANPAVLWFAQLVVMLAMYALRILAVVLLLGALLHLSAPSSYSVVWLGFVSAAVLASYACRHIVSRLRTKRGKF